MVTKTTDRRVPSGVIYTLAESGEKLSDGVFEKLTANLAPIAGGLFGTEMSQTFAWRPDA